MFLTEDERIILTRVLQRLLTVEPQSRGLTIREQREIRKKAQDNGAKTEKPAGS
jgi:hypothetical protein